MGTKALIPHYRFLAQSFLADQHAVFQFRKHLAAIEAAFIIPILPSPLMRAWRLPNCDIPVRTELREASGSP